MIAKILIPGVLALATFASAAGYATYSSLTAPAETGTQATAGGGCCSQSSGCPSTMQASACQAETEEVATACCGNGDAACCDNDPECCGPSEACCIQGLPCCEAATTSNTPVVETEQPTAEAQATAAN